MIVKIRSDIHDYEYYHDSEFLNISIHNTKIKHGFLECYALTITFLGCILGNFVGKLANTLYV